MPVRHCWLEFGWIWDRLAAESSRLKNMALALRWLTRRTAGDTMSELCDVHQHTLALSRTPAWIRARAAAGERAEWSAKSPG